MPMEYRQTVGLDVVTGAKGPIFASQGHCWWTSREADLHYLNVDRRAEDSPVGYAIISHDEAMRLIREARRANNPRAPRLVPCDPTGVPVAVMSRDAFIRRAAQAVEQFGRNGLRTWLAAHHGNTIDELGHPAVSGDWAEYDTAVSRALGRR